MSKNEALAPASELAKKNGVRIPNESDEYRRARTALLAEEIELRRHIERVAKQRRALPPGGEVPEDYEFRGEDGRTVKLSEMFGDSDTLVTYIWMYGPKRERPCPMCTALLGSLDGEARDIMRRVPLAVIGRSPIERQKEFKKERGCEGSNSMRMTTARSRATIAGSIPRMTAKTGPHSTSSSATRTARFVCSGPTR